MARERFPGDRFKFNTRQRLTSTDLQEAIELNDVTTRRAFAPFVRFGNGRNGFVLQGMKVVEDSPTAMTLRVGVGRCILWDSTELDGIDASVYDENYHGYHEACVDNAVEEVTIAANSSGNPRIDIIVARLVVEDAEEQNVDIFNTTTRVFDSTPSTPTRIRKQLKVSNSGLVVVQGTAAASPTEPAIEAYDIPLAAVYVANGAATLANAVIHDRRPKMLNSKAAVFCANTGAFQTVAFYGTTKTLKDCSGGIIGEAPTIVFYDKPATGRYRYTLSNFITMLGGAPMATAQVSIDGTSGGQYSVQFNASDPHLEIRTFDNAGVAADKAFTLVVEDRDWNVTT